MSIIDEIKTVNTKEFTLVCGHCREKIMRHSLVELGESVIHNRELNCRVCKDCNREITINDILDD
jgi:uncharacterized CHY-type Zn-finger protein